MKLVLTVFSGRSRYRRHILIILLILAGIKLSKKSIPSNVTSRSTAAQDRSDQNLQHFLRNDPSSYSLDQLRELNILIVNKIMEVQDKIVDDIGHDDENSNAHDERIGYKLKFTITFEV